MGALTFVPRICVCTVLAVGTVSPVAAQTAGPLLNQPAIDAARRWEFTPTVVNGEPKPIVLMLELDFNLR